MAAHDKISAAVFLKECSCEPSRPRPGAVPLVGEVKYLKLTLGLCSPLLDGTEHIKSILSIR